jgi:transposase
MAMGKRKRQRQQSLWVETGRLAKGPSHPFYRRLNQILAERRFDEFVEATCQRFYCERMGRPSVPPAVYFRLLLIGYFEGIDSERGIAWRVADSIALRDFLGYPLTETTPDHSTISRNRRLIDLQAHQEVFTWVLQVLAKSGLLKGETLGIDATTLEANAALRSIVRRDTGESYREFLTRLAQASGIETPTREDLARLDRNRSGKGSNDEWQHPQDTDARITKMKNGQTHLAHKAEHAVDLETGAVVAVTVQPADRGDTTSVEETLQEAMDVLADVSEDQQAAEGLGDEVLSEIVADKGYHSNAVLTGRERMGIRTYLSEPRRGRRNWRGKPAERHATYANRRRIRGERGKRLLRLRGERVERTFAHCYETGGMRRTHLRGHRNIAKRLLVHTAGFNLSLLLRQLLGFGKPRQIQGAARRLFALLVALLRPLQALQRVVLADLLDSARQISARPLFQVGTAITWPSAKIMAFATGC